MKSKQVIATIIITGVSLGGASFAFADETTNTNRGRGRGNMGGIQINRDAIVSALANNDYTAFTTAISGTPLAGTITQEQFKTLVSAYQLYKSGDTTGAKKLLLGTTWNGRLGEMIQHMIAMPELTADQKKIMEQAHALIEQGKKSEAKKLLESSNIPRPESAGPRGLGNLTDEQRKIADQARELYKQGKTTEADALLKTAGIEVPPGFGNVQKNKGLQNLTDAQKTALNQARELAKAGNYDAAKQVIIDAGLPAHISQKLQNELSPQAEQRRQIMRQASELQKQGKKEDAAKLLKENGITRMQHFWNKVMNPTNANALTTTQS